MCKSPNPLHVGSGYTRPVLCSYISLLVRMLHYTVIISGNIIEIYGKCIYIDYSHTKMAKMKIYL